ncbi:MAG: hypothetical protein ACRC7O_09845 [Fimbriiglobus sp.]
MTGPMSKSDLRRRAAAVFEQQCWCWGRDIARPLGNLLLGLGMCRRAPGPKAASSLYTGLAPNGGTVWLWAFGTAFTDPAVGSVFVPRYDFTPRLTRRTDFVGVHDPKAIGGLVTPTAATASQSLRRLLVSLVEWAAGYEHWVAETHGTEYRTRCLAARDRSPAVPAADMAREWERLARKFRRPMAVGSSTPGPWAGVIDRLRPARGLPSTGTTPARPTGRFRRP